MKLAGLQRALARHAARAEDALELESQLRDRAPGAKARLDVYRSLVEEAHLDALSRTFAVTVEVLGEGYWRTLLRECWQGPGSASADLSDYGAFVPEFLDVAVASREELEPLAHVPELARLEWAVHQAVGRTGPERFDWSAFAELPQAQQAQARLLPSPALAKHRLTAPVDEIWRRHRGVPAEPAQTTRPASSGPLLCCLHPVGRFDIGVSRWHAHEEALLDRLLEGASLTSLDALGSAEGAERLHAWIEAGWLVGFTTD